MDSKNHPVPTLWNEGTAIFHLYGNTGTSPFHPGDPVSDAGTGTLSPMHLTRDLETLAGIRKGFSCCCACLSIPGSAFLPGTRVRQQQERVLPFLIPA